MALLEVKNLHAGYGKKQVLYDISFEVEQGDIVLLMGGNGSGKSTLLKAIYGLLNDYKDKKGTITFANNDITECFSYQMIKKGLAYVPQKNNTFEQLTLIENLQLVATNLLEENQIKRSINKVFERLPQLTTLKNRKPFNLSGGERQQLALGMALILSPKMIMLDEPSAGLAPNTWQKNLQIIKALNQQGFTFLIVEHRIAEIIEKVDNILQMKLGRIIKNDSKSILTEYEH